MKVLIAFVIVVLLSGGSCLAASDRFISTIKLPTGQTAVVAEGDLEARSIGSFSVRLYAAAPVGDLTTFFLAGLVRPRDGTIERVAVADVGGTKDPEIVVVVRSAGTGGYLSAEAFAFDQENLILCASVQGLAPDADPLAALREARAQK